MTRSRLTAATAWAQLDGVPVFENTIDIRHDGKKRSTFTNRSGPALTWRAAFDGKWKVLTVDGRPTEALQGRNEAGGDMSWVSVAVQPGRIITVDAVPGSVVDAAAGAAAPSSPCLTREVDAYLQPFIDSGGFSGAVLMAKGGRVLIEKGYGSRIAFIGSDRVPFAPARAIRRRPSSRPPSLRW
jgi:hypothetical protein